MESLPHSAIAYEIQSSILCVIFCVILLHPDNRAYHRQASRIYSANDNDFQHNEFVRLLLLRDDVFMLLFIEWDMHFSCGMISADDSDVGAQEKNSILFNERRLLHAHDANENSFEDVQTQITCRMTQIKWSSMCRRTPLRCTNFNLNHGQPIKEDNKFSATCLESELKAKISDGQRLCTEIIVSKWKAADKHVSWETFRHRHSGG